MSEQVSEGTAARWWTNCPTCNMGISLSDQLGGNGLLYPGEGDPLYCPYDGDLLTGWNSDPS
jgi:hypothetical protein